MCNLKEKCELDISRVFNRRFRYSKVFTYVRDVFRSYTFFFPGKLGNPYTRTTHLYLFSILLKHELLVFRDAQARPFSFGLKCMYKK